MTTLEQYLAQCFHTSKTMHPGDDRDSFRKRKVLVAKWVTEKFPDIEGIEEIVDDMFPNPIRLFVD